MTLEIANDTLITLIKIAEAYTTLYDTFGAINADLGDPFDAIGEICTVLGDITTNQAYAGEDGYEKRESLFQTETTAQAKLSILFPSQ